MRRFPSGIPGLDWVHYPSSSTYVETYKLIEHNTPTPGHAMSDGAYRMGMYLRSNGAWQLYVEGRPIGDRYSVRADPPELFEVAIQTAALYKLENA